MKQFHITVTCAGVKTQFTGIFKNAMSAFDAGMDQLTDPHGRVEVKPA